MNKTFRFLIAITFVLTVTIVARNNVAWAGTGAASEQAVSPQEQTSPGLDKPEPGSVKPPPGEITACENGVKSVGGVSTLEVTNLAPGYCIVAFLRNHAFAVGRIPDGVGDVLAHITFLRIFYHGKLVHELPIEDGQAELCYATVPDKTAEMYFFDFYGPQLGERTGQPSWAPMETKLDGTVACTPAQITGAYALIGK